MKTWALLVVTVAFVVCASMVSVELWSDQEEVIAADVTLEMNAQMTVVQFGEVNNFSDSFLKEVFPLGSSAQLDRTLDSFGMSLEQIAVTIDKKLALEAEHATKNWFKIPLKFLLWFLFMGVSFVLLRKRKITKRTRMILYASAFTLFGVVLSADPSPMGTVKDAIVLYASKGVIFKPRLVAFGVLSLTVILANKFICSWGCQIGTLQDFIFRLNRNGDDTDRGAFPQFRIPFVVSNSIRILFFIALVWIAFSWSYDITHEIDPFKIFKPLKMSSIGWTFVPAVLLLSLFVYRPWCHLFCPFGLTGWVFEKLSLFRIKVDYNKCIDCQACVNACPSSVMGAILKQDKTVIPDCFSCGNCLEACPTEAVSFARGKRSKSVGMSWTAEEGTRKA